MRIAVPIHDGKFSQHFGGAEAFGFYSVDDADRTVAEHEIESPPEHGRGVFPMWLHRKGTTVVLAGGMGPRAVDMFGRHGIEVVLGVRGVDPDTVVRSFLDGTLEATGESCHDHGYHDCGHDHGNHPAGGCRES